MKQENNSLSTSLFGDRQSIAHVGLQILNPIRVNLMFFEHALDCSKYNGLAIIGLFRVLNQCYIISWSFPCLSNMGPCSHTIKQSSPRTNYKGPPSLHSNKFTTRPKLRVSFKHVAHAWHEHLLVLRVCSIQVNSSLPCYDQDMFHEVSEGGQITHPMELIHEFSRVIDRLHHSAASKSVHCKLPPRLATSWRLFAVYG